MAEQLTFTQSAGEAFEESEASARNIVGTPPAIGPIYWVRIVSGGFRAVRYSVETFVLEWDVTIASGLTDLAGIAVTSGGLYVLVYNETASHDPTIYQLDRADGSVIRTKAVDDIVIGATTFDARPYGISPTYAAAGVVVTAASSTEDLTAARYSATLNLEQISTQQFAIVGGTSRVQMTRAPQTTAADSTGDVLAASLHRFSPSPNKTMLQIGHPSLAITQYWSTQNLRTAPIAGSSTGNPILYVEQESGTFPSRWYALNSDGPWIDSLGERDQPTAINSGCCAFTGNFCFCSGRGDLFKMAPPALAQFTRVADFDIRLPGRAEAKFVRSDGTLIYLLVDAQPESNDYHLLVVEPILFQLVASVPGAIPNGPGGFERCVMHTGGQGIHDPSQFPQA